MSESLSIPVRITKAQARLVSAGLKRIVAAYAQYQHRGSSEHAFFYFQHELTFNGKVMNKLGLFDRDHMTDILNLSIITTAKRSQHVIRVTYFQLAAAILAVRINEDFRRHKEMRKATATEARLIKSTINSLERELKRARRIYVSTNGEFGLHRRRHMWRLHIKWIRTHLTYYQPQPLKNQLRRVRRRIIEDIEAIAREGLATEGYETPAPNELRRLVRLALRYTRRGRNGWSVPSLRNRHHRWAATGYLAEFITERTKLRQINPKDQDHDEE